MAASGLNERMQATLGIGSWMVCSVGMMVFNKAAVKAFPCACTLCALQMLATVAVMVIFCWRSIHIGSVRDVLRWSMVVPFFTGMLLTSILALEEAPMTLVTTFRALSPLLSLALERFYPNPLRISPAMLGSIGMMVLGAAIYIWGMQAQAADAQPGVDKEVRHQMMGIFWVLLNSFFAVGDRLLQRLMLAKDQQPVDISKTGVTLLNNLEGLVPLLLVAFLNSEFDKAPAAFRSLDTAGWFWVAASCAVGCGISYSGVWAQSLISATSFLVLVNANKFAVIILEVYVLHAKNLSSVQQLGALVSVLAACAYGKARQDLEAERQSLKGCGETAAEEGEASEATPLVAAKLG